MSKSGSEDKIYLVKLDDKAAFEALQRKKAYVVTYGLGSKATLTVSSMEPTHIVLCLQRSIEDISGRVIEPQEFSVNLLNEYDIETIMQIAAVCIISGVSFEALSKFVF